MGVLMIRIVAYILLLTGGLMLVVGLGADLIFAGNSGFSTAQLITTIAGFIVLITGYVLRSQAVQSRLRQRSAISGWRTVGIVIVSIAATLVTLEIVLAIAGVSPRYFGDPTGHDYPPAPWWLCDEHGCRYDWEAMQGDCTEEDRLVHRRCLINSQGFYDSDEFVHSEALDSATFKILALGDSFTWGATSDIGASWVELLDAQFEDAVVWNTGIVGVGTNQAWASLQHLAPTMEPDLVIIGFYINDFEDNQYPLDSFFWWITPGETLGAVRRYRINNDLSSEKLSNEQLYYRVQGIREPRNGLEHALGRTRLGTVLLMALDAAELILNPRETRWNYSVEQTRLYLTQVRDYVEAADAQLLVLLIPHRNDFTSPGRQYLTAQQLFGELSIAYIDLGERLDPDIDYAPSPDTHWDNEGHAKVGQIVLECAMAISTGESPETCQQAGDR